MSKNTLFILPVSLFIIFSNQLIIAQDSDTLSSKESLPQVQKNNKETIVYVTKTGEKYHREDCRYLSKSKIPKKLEDIIPAYDPCSVCDPPLLGVESVQDDKDKEKSKSKETYKSTDKKSVATQCLGTTKKGKRCKRKTKDTSGYCWQHR